MLKVLIILAAIYFVYKHFKDKMIDGLGPEDSNDSGDRGVDDVMVQDPECRVYFPLRDSVSARIDGQTVNFCSIACRDAYLKKQQ